MTKSVDMDGVVRSERYSDDDIEEAPLAAPAPEQAQEQAPARVRSTVRIRTEKPKRTYSDDIISQDFLAVGAETDMEERLRLLEDAVNHNVDTLQKMRDINANLKVENRNLKKKVENRDGDGDKRTLMLLQQLSTKVVNKELRTLSDDVYSFLFCSKVLSVPSFIGLGTVFIQFSVFALFLGDLLNTQEIPANVETLVRVGQAGAILINFMAQTDVRTGMRALIYQEGVEALENEFAGFTRRRFIIANIFMLSQGLLGTVVSIQLIVYSDNIFDLLLNFTAVMFVSELDELVFYMARNGYLGIKSEKLAEKIQELEFGTQNRAGVSGYMHVILFGLLVIAGYIYFAVIIGLQAGNTSLPVYVKAEFGDSVDPTLGLYSGCYKMIPGPTWSSRVTYKQVQTERGQGRFTYCYDDIRSWSFSPLSVAEEDACEYPALQSAEERPTSFDLLDAKGDQWKLPSGNPIQTFQLVEVDENRVDAECGEIFGGGDSEEELCPIITMEQSFTGFSDDRDWSRSYNQMLAEDGKPVYFYQHPIYVGEFVDPKEGLELIFFTGRRWLSTTAQGLTTEADEGVDLSSEAAMLSLLRDKTDVTDFRLLSLERGAYAFISQSVDQANDRGTPLGLRWYHSRYGDNGFDSFPFADISRPADALFSCGKCDSERNPCRFEGVCLADGTCDCKHGATGKLCEIKPLANGICNPYFNKGPDRFDGGDCCVSTCEGVSCGVGDMTEAFGQELRRSGNGYPYCIDPNMVPLTITMNHTIDPTFFSGVEDTAGGTFESYFLEVNCNDGEEIPIRVALDPEIVRESSQTLYVADQMGGCAISFLGIQSTSLFNATFQLIDGLPEDAANVAVASSEMRDISDVTKDATFMIPTLYAKCLKETLKDVVDTSAYYSGTYQDEAMSWMNAEIKNARCSNDEEWRIQRYALVALWRAEGSPVEWVNKNDHCLWSRINCKDNHPVVITHDGDTTGRLNGTLATEIGLLTHLERLDVFTNDLTGTLPSELGLLTKLTFLGYAQNAHTGTIPTEVGQLTALEKLLLWQNQLTGSIPSEIGLLSDLGEINLQENNLFGSLPSELGALTKLTRLTLFTNYFSGSLPAEISLMTSLTNIVMTQNSLTGAIPDLSKLSNLDTLILFANLLSGPLPTTELSKLPTLFTLNLSTNEFSGTIPQEWAELTSLYWMIVNKNQLTGTIPEFLGTSYPDLNRLVLDENQLVGSIPDSFANLSNMARLRLQSNQLTGELKPEVFGGWTSMGQLYLSYNQFNGTLPSEIGMLSDMDYFEASGNQFSGQLPDELWTNTNMNTLYLDNNQFTGSVPTEIGLLSNMLYMDLTGNNLTGTIPSEIAMIPNLSWFQILAGNSFTGTVPSEVCDVLIANGATSDVMDSCLSGTSVGAEPEPINETTPPTDATPTPTDATTP
ncbi:unnamed protein product [Cylindrotheca closterium]|uniref:EGF-like domain-containing protein n=1 Tax=Cylindrotheca closterium TaxID=2856 RepID=A0AAD2CWQ8_9STRA|nr:unnamed protein product [Cylindrotheca closterium]